MTDKMKVYSKVNSALKKMLPTACQHQTVVLSMLVAGIVSGRKAQLSEISQHVPSAAQPASLAKRFQRFVKNRRVVKETLFLPFAEQLLAHLADKRLFISMDASQVGRGCMTLMLAVIYRQRALPLVWIVYEGKKGHTTAERHIEVLKLLALLVPAECDLVLLGDAEYDTVEMLTWLEKTTSWHYVVRTDPRILVEESGLHYRLADLLSGDDETIALTDVLFTRQKLAVPIVVATWHQPHKRPLYLLSNHASLKDVCRFYKKRFKVETMFSDQKSRGFHIHKSHLQHPERVARLLLAVAIAYMWVVYLGTTISEDESRRRLIDRPNRQDKSLFRLGLDWLKYVLCRGLDFNVQFSPPANSIVLGVR